MVKSNRSILHIDVPYVICMYFHYTYNIYTNSSALSMQEVKTNAFESSDEDKSNSKNIQQLTLHKTINGSINNLQFVS